MIYDLNGNGRITYRELEIIDKYYRQALYNYYDVERGLRAIIESRKEYDKNILDDQVYLKEIYGI